MHVPVAISTYKRRFHVERCIDSLRENREARTTHLYVFSDAPRPGDEKAVLSVRDYIRAITGFSSVTLVERRTNNRVANNRGGLYRLLREFGVAIMIEEDVVVSPHFLTYMNEALKRYREDPNVVAICGYSPPVSAPTDYPYDAYFSRRFNAWGFGIWLEKYRELDFNFRNARSVLRDRVALQSLRTWGDDLETKISKSVVGELDAMDVRIMYTQFRRNLVTLHPTTSLTHNIGFDGSGMHSVPTTKFEVSVDPHFRVRRWPNRTTPFEWVERQYRRFRRLPFYSRVLASIRARHRVHLGRRR